MEKLSSVLFPDGHVKEILQIWKANTGTKRGILNVVLPDQLEKKGRMACLPLPSPYLSLSFGLSQVHRLWELHKHRRTTIGHTSEPRHQLILPTASCSLPLTPRLWKHRLTGAEPHAVFLPAHIISLYLHSPLKLLLFSSHSADNFAVIFDARGEGCRIKKKNVPTEPHASLCNHNK